jgi:tetratricopeptide (TPR) repeat protein
MPGETKRGAWEALRTNPNVTADDILQLLGQTDEAEFMALVTGTLPGPQRQVVGALVGAADISLRRQDLEGAARLVDLTERVGQAVQNRWAQAQAAYWRGALEMARGHPEAAAGSFERAADGAETVQERVVALYNAGRAWHSAGKLTEAERLLEAGRAAALAEGYDLGQAECSLLLGVIAREKNQPDEAVRQFERAREAAARAGAGHLSAHAAGELGILHAMQKDHAAARAAYQEFEQYQTQQSVARSPDDRIRAASALRINQALLAVREGKLDIARPLAEEALRDQERLPLTEQVDNLVSAATVEFVTGDLNAAVRHFLAALRLAERGGYPKGRFEAGLGLSQVYTLFGYFEPAHRVCGAAIDALERQRRHVGGESDRLSYLQQRTDAYGHMVELCVVLDDLQEAPAFRVQALAYAERARSRTLIEALGPTTAIVPPGHVPEGLRRDEAALLARAQAADVALRTSPGEDVRREYDAAQDELNTLWDQMAAAAPEYVALRRGRPLDFDEIRALLC